MSADVCSAQNRAFPPGEPKEGCFMHPSPWQRGLVTFTCTYVPEELVQCTTSKNAQQATQRGRLGKQAGRNLLSLACTS